MQLKKTFFFNFRKTRYKFIFMYVQMQEHLLPYNVFLWMCFPNSFSDMTPLNNNIWMKGQKIWMHLWCVELSWMELENKLYQCPNHKKQIITLRGSYIFTLKYNFCNCQNREEAPDDLSELQSEAVPEEVRKWLSSTFAKQESTVRRSEERPSFKSVANAIRTGIFIERIYRRMSSSQLMVMPPEVQKALKVSSKSYVSFTSIF